MTCCLFVILKMLPLNKKESTYNHCHCWAEKRKSKIWVLHYRFGQALRWIAVQQASLYGKAAGRSTGKRLGYELWRPRSWWRQRSSQCQRKFAQGILHGWFTSIVVHSHMMNSQSPCGLNFGVFWAEHNGKFCSFITPHNRVNRV